MKFTGISLAPWKNTLITVFVLLCLDAIVLYSTHDTVVFTVEKSERITNANDEGGKYLIFTKAETFENTDRLVLWKFNSSDLYGLLKVGKAYEAKVVGFRIPFLSWYRNIVSFREK
jgi:hypothetical protein